MDRFEIDNFLEISSPTATNAPRMFRKRPPWHLGDADEVVLRTAMVGEAVTTPSGLAENLLLLSGLPECHLQPDESLLALHRPPGPAGRSSSGVRRCLAPHHVLTPIRWVDLSAFQNLGHGLTSS